MEIEKLSKHFTLEELCRTSVRTAEGNRPQPQHIENLRRLCRNWLEPLRYAYNCRYVLAEDESYDTYPYAEPIIISSGYRSVAVNKAVGGAANSNHLTGCAVDIRAAGLEQALRYAVLLLDISDERKADFDELLLERNARGSYWIHLAVRPHGNRRKVNFKH